MEASTGSSILTTEVVTEQQPKEKEELVLRLRSAPVPNAPRVTFAADVVDNEHMGRLKSNCCCIYVRPRQWDDPTTWEQDEYETEHCRGHTLPPPRRQPDSEDGDCKDSQLHDEARSNSHDNQCC